jgi:flagellin FlaB
MNLIRKGHGHSHRGVIGIESAIVLIAFVIVAAALAFVVLNMGFATTQKAKTSIVATLGEAGSSLQISGKVISWADLANSEVDVIGIPIKIASGGESVNLDPAFAAVKLVTSDRTYSDIYQGITTVGAISLEAGTTEAVNNFNANGCDSNPITTGPGTNPADTCAFIYFTVDNNGNDILDQGEHAVLGVMFRASDTPNALDKVKIELIPPSGATLSVERQIPNLSTDYVDLG